MTANSQSENISATRPPIQVVRYDELIPCYNAFIDTRTPGSDQKENFTIIGPGVSENPEQHVHITEPHGFNIGAARQPSGCVNSQHSHETEEVFFVHQGTWSFNLGEKGDDAKIVLNPGDLISIPTHVFRGFENIGGDMGFLWAILGGDDPGHVLWAPDVFRMAEQYGLVLLENGCLIDTEKGETVPEGKRPMPVTTAEQISKFNRFDDARLRDCCVLSDQIKENRASLIGDEGMLNWPHGFTLEQRILPAGRTSDAEVFSESEVVFVHEGKLTITSDQDSGTVAAGDTATICPESSRQYTNSGQNEVKFLVVRGKV